MKKLMTMLAAAAMAFGLYADPLANTWTAAEKTAADWNDGLWAEDGTNAVTLGTSGVTETPVIEFKTGSAKLARLVQTASGGFLVESNVFFDVNLDLCGQALTEVPEVNSDAKLQLFVLNNAEDCGYTGDKPWTALYALGAYGADGKALYRLDADVDAVTNGLNRLTIKAYANVMKSGARGGFVVFLNGKSAAEKASVLTAAKTYVLNNDGTVNWDEISSSDPYNGFAKSALDGKVASRYDEKSLIPSLKTGATTFTAMDFIGTAKVGDVTINEAGFDYIEADALQMVLSLDEGLSIANLDPVDAIVEGVIEAPCTFTVTSTDQTLTLFKKGAGDNSSATVTKAGVVTVSTVEYGKTLAITAVAPAATVDGEAYETIADAIAAANTAAASAPVTLVLSKDHNEEDDSLVLGGDNKITLDLNGKKLDFSEGWNIGLTASGDLEITDSSVAKTGRIIGSVSCESGKLTITGGSFDKDSNSTEADPPAFTLADNVADGFTVGEKTIEEVDFWTVQEKAGVVITIAESNAMKATKITQDGEDFAITDKIDPEKDFTVTFEAESGYVFEGDLAVTTKDYMAGTTTIDAAALPAALEAVAEIVGGKQFATIAAALTAATSADTVKLLKNAELGDKVSTAAKALDLGDKTLSPNNSGTTLSFTSAVGVTVSNGELAMAKTQLTINVVAGQNLTIEDIVSHSTQIAPGVTGTAAQYGVFEMKNCRMLKDVNFEGTTETFGDFTDQTLITKYSNANTQLYPSFALALGTGFAVAKVHDNYLEVGARGALSTSEKTMDVFVYGNAIVAVKNCHNGAETAYRFPAIQAQGAKSLVFENNALTNLAAATTKPLDGAFCVYLSNGKQCADPLYLINGNIFSNVEHAWCFYKPSDTIPAQMKLFIGENDATGVDWTGAYYKTQIYGTGAFTSDINLALPEDYDYVYEWALDDEFYPFFVDGTGAANLAGLTTENIGDTVFAYPGADISSLPETLSLTDDETYANKFTVAAQVTALQFAVTKDANITALKYAINGGDQADVPAEGTIAVAAGETIQFFPTCADGYYATAAIAGQFTADGAVEFKYTANAKLTSATATVDFLGTLAWAKDKDGNLIKAFDDLWKTAKTEGNYVTLLTDIVGSSQQLSFTNKETAVACVNPNGHKIYTSGKIAVVEGTPYNTYTGYSTLKAAWDAKGKAATYILSGGCDVANSVALTEANDVFVWTPGINVGGSEYSGTIAEGVVTKPVDTTEKTYEIEISADGFTYTLKTTTVSTDPIPAPAEDTPEAVSNALFEAGIVAADVTSKDDLVVVNAMITKKYGDAAKASDLSEGEKANMNDSFLMSDITKGYLFGNPAEIKIEKIEATATAGTYEFTVSVSDGLTPFELAQEGAEKLAGKVLIGTEVGAITTKVAPENLTVKEVADGKAVFDIAYGNGAQGFMKVKVTK